MKKAKNTKKKKKCKKISSEHTYRYGTKPHIILLYTYVVLYTYIGIPIYYSKQMPLFGRARVVVGFFEIRNNLYHRRGVENIDKLLSITALTPAGAALAEDKSARPAVNATGIIRIIMLSRAGRVRP